jgi:hypothetical protein
MRSQVYTDLCSIVATGRLAASRSPAGKLNDLPPDQLCHAISQADGELKLGAHGFKRLCMTLICSTSNAKLRDPALGMVKLPEWGRPGHTARYCSARANV